MQISDYLKYADLQMAAEAFLTGKNGVMANEDLVEALQSGNNHASRFTAAQAKNFAEEWIVVEQKENSSTGFSGTLFKSKATNEYVVSFRSTEFIDDAARDNQATNDLEIKTFGFALGQISDMEEWYKSLISSGKLPSGTDLSVTGYSLGGHLATAFNRLHMDDAGGLPHIKEVVTFNGAGIGKVPAGETLQSLLDKFNYLRDPVKSAAERFSFTDAKVISVYDSIRNAVANNRSILDSDRTTLALLALDVKTKIPALQLAEAVNRIDTIRTEVERLAHIKSGAQLDIPGELDGPKKVDSSEISQVSLDYQMAVVFVGLPTMAASLVSGALQAYNGKAYFGTERSENQYDVVGATTPSAVGNSQWHYGADVPIFIEDQPLYRGASPSKAAAESFRNGGVKLLVDGYDKSDFGDTHSLVLLVDSLNVQNLLLGFLPEGQRAVGAETLKTVFLAASSMVSSSGGLFGAGDQGKSEGDVLENVLNALAELCVPGAKRLNGSTTGNTWATIVDKDGYTGRDSLYSVIQAIADSSMFKKAVDGSISVSLHTVDGDLASRARTDFGAYAALVGLSPFAFSIIASDSELAEIFKAYPGYADWEADKATFAKGPETDDYNITQQWLHDRNEFLKQKSFFNTNNINSVDYSVQQNSSTVDFRTFSGKMYFEDVDSGYKIVPGDVSSTSEIKRFYFGDEQSNGFSGAAWADHLYGGAGADTLDGMAGNDYLEGGAGGDVLSGGAGADALWGSEGNDSLSGDDDSDNLTGGAGDDTLDGGAGNDQLKGGAGSDTYRFSGTYGKDVIEDAGGAGAIMVDGVALHGGKKTAEGVYKDQASGWMYLKIGTDLVLAKSGDKDNSIVIKNWSPGTALGIRLDGELPVSKPSNLTGDFEKKIEGGSYVFDDSGINYAGSNVPGSIAGSGGDASAGQQGAVDKKFNDLLTGGVNNDTIIGLTGNDGLDGGGGADVIDGGVGNDLIFGGDGADTLFGGAGRDWIIGSGNAQFEYPRNVDTPGPVALGVEDIRGLNWVTFTKSNGNWSYLGANNNALVANDSGNLIDGGSGADQIIAGTGDDSVFGGADNDYIEGQAGIDLLYGGDGADTLCGDSSAEPGSMDTTPAALQLGDLLDGGAGDDNMSGQGGDDTLAGGEGNDFVWGDFDDVSVTPLSVHGNDHLDGGDGNDELIGGGRADVVLGGDGDDKLWGDDVQSKVPGTVHGDDYLDGGKGRDLLTGGGGNDVLYGSEGNDQLIGDDVASNLVVSAHGNDTLDGGDGADVMFGGGKDDFLVGGEGNDVAFGDDSPDSILEGASHGRDTLDGGNGDDSLFGGGSDDTLMGGAGNDSLVGDDGFGTLDIKLHGNDVLDGADGADVLVGGGGSDTLFGGDGADALFGADQSIGCQTPGLPGTMCSMAAVAMTR